MLNKLRQLLLKSTRIRQAVIDHNKRLKAQHKQEKWASYFEAGGTIR